MVLGPRNWVDIRISMAYVDLNPIRAAMAKTPESSDYTSIQERLTKKSTNLLNLGFDESDIDFTLADYIDLVDSTGRLIVTGKKGFINKDLPSVLKRLGVEGITWIDELNQFKSKGKIAIMIYVHVNPTLCRLPRSNLIQSNLVEHLKSLSNISKISRTKSS